MKICGTPTDKGRVRDRAGAVMDHLPTRREQCAALGQAGASREESTEQLRMFVRLLNALGLGCKRLESLTDGRLGGILLFYLYSDDGVRELALFQSVAHALTRQQVAAVSLSTTVDSKRSKRCRRPGLFATKLPYLLAASLACLPIPLKRRSTGGYLQAASSLPLSNS